LRKAKDEAQQILKDANKLVENTIADIKSVKADKEKTKEIRGKLTRAADAHRVKPVKQSAAAAEVTQEDHVIEVGDWVRITDSGNEAEVMEVAKNNNLILALGDLRTVVKRTKVVKLRSKEKSKAIKKSTGHTPSGADFSPEVDVRGMRTEDALQKLEAVLDRAVMIGYPNLKIVHGKGDGILRKFIREYLRKYSHVSRFEDEHADRGGDGITYAYID